MKRYSLHTNNEDRTVILANGNFPTHRIPLHILNHCEYLVACDGATNKLVDNGYIPHAIVGDCDSLSFTNKNRFANIIHREEEQETNDLTKAVSFCIKRGRKDIIILGATGMREDHTIGNISLLAEYLSSANVTMITNYGIFTAIDKDSIFETHQGQQVSLFPLDGQAISSIGLKYKIENQVYNRWWQATLNESEADEFIIKTKGIVIVYRKF